MNIIASFKESEWVQKNNTKRYARLTELLARLESNKDVAQRDLKLALTAKQFADISKQWKLQKELRQLEKPAEIVEYERLVQKAVMLYGRTEGRGTFQVDATKRKVNAKLSTQAESAFEDAITRLEEILSVDTTLLVWLDRNVSFAPGEGIDCDPVSIPRVVTSRSLDKLAGLEERFSSQSKRQLKINALREALDELDAEAKRKELGISKKQHDAAQSAKLKDLLGKIKNV